MTYSAEQLAIFDFIQNGSGSLIVPAYAGSGKTFTATHATKYMGDGSICGMAFNKSIAYELGLKLKNMKVFNAVASTVHSNGNTTYRKFRPNVKVNLKKLLDISFEVIDEEDDLKFARFAIIRLINFARDYGFGIPECPAIDDREAWYDIIAHQDISFPQYTDVSDCVEAAIAILKLSNNDLDQMDYGDMVYLPILLDIPFEKYDWVIVDESQDTNVVRKLIIQKMLKPTGRLVAIGDPNQAIYGFTGAEHDSMSKIKDIFNCTELALTTCYRCAQAIIREAQKYVPDIKAADNAPEGEVKHIDYDDFINSISDWNLDSNTGIICRNNAPLTAIAFELIRQGIGCEIRGKDIGESMLTLARKWKRVSNLEEFAAKLTEFMDREMSKAKKMKKALLEDRYQTILVIMERCMSEGDGTLNCLIRTIEDMFKVGPRYKNHVSKKDVVVLSSIHKAKGLEWDTCMIIGQSQLQPSRWATQEWMQIQERNLMYVACTRAMNTLVFVDNIPDFRTIDAEDTGE